MPATPSPVRCPACGSALLGGGISAWCPGCALQDAGGVDEGPGLFVVPGHVVLEELGRGAAGIVYRARQERPARGVALKILRPHEAGSAEALARFRLEAATVATLDHPAILPVFGMGECDGLPYFTMKLCRDTLAGQLGRYHGNWRAAAELVALIADAVQHAHARGVLHRDLKPGNVLFDEADRAFVSDFGLAKAIGPAAGSGPVTRPLMVMGTPGYLAPELLAGGASAATTAADIYALGAILHELGTGAPPPAIAAAQAPRPGMPRDLAVICAKALAVEPATRYPTAEAFANDLRAWLAGRPISARPMTGFERAATWARRNPGLAGVSTALGLALAASVVVFAAKNRELRAALAAAQTAEARSQASLAESLVAQARAVRQSGREGQRREALALLRRAAAIAPTVVARNEAVAALLLPDWEQDVRTKLWEGNALTAVPQPDFRGLLVEDEAGNFTLRDLAGAKRWAYAAGSSSATYPVFSADGRWLALHLRDDTVQVLAVADGRRLFQLSGRTYAFKGAVWMYGRPLDVTPDGKMLAMTRPEGGVTFHALPGGEQIAEWRTPEWITNLQFSPDGTRLAAGGAKERAHSLLAVVEAATGRELAREKPSGRVEFIAWSPDARWLASRPLGGATEVREADTLALRATVPDKAALHGLFLPGSDRLLLTQQIEETRLWDIARGQLLLAKRDAGRPGNWWRAGAAEQWRSSMASPVIRQAFADSPVLRSWNAPEQDYTVTDMVWTLDVSPDRKLIAMAGWGGGTLLRADTGEPVLRIMLTEKSDPGTLRFDPAGDAVWVGVRSLGLSRVPLVRDPAGGWVAGAPEQMDVPPGFLVADCNGTSGRLALVDNEKGLVRVYDTRTRRTVAAWSHTGAALASFSPDGMRLAVNALTEGPSPGKSATVYEVGTGAVVRVLGAEAGRVVRWSPGGAWLLAGDGPRMTRLWRTADWSPGPALEDEEVQGDTICAAFSPDDQQFAVWTGDNIRLMDTATARTDLTIAQPAGTGYLLDLNFDDEGGLWALALNGRRHRWDLAALRRELAAAGLGGVRGK